MKKFYRIENCYGITLKFYNSGFNDINLRNITENHTRKSKLHFGTCTTRFFKIKFVLVI